MREMNSGLRGVGGLLAFLVLSLMLIGPVSRIIGTAREFDKSKSEVSTLDEDLRWDRYEQVSWLITAICASLSFAAGYRLWKIHRRNSVHFAILALWIMMPVASVLQSLSALAIYGSEQASTMLLAMLKASLLSTLIAGLWTGYLMLSERVQNTYLDD